jgi:hypothetical protein
MKKLLFFFLILAQALTANGQKSNQSNRINLNWKLYESAEFSIRHPSNWELNLERKMGETFILYSPVETSQDKFRENVNLFEENLSSNNLSLDLYAQSSIIQIKNFITNFILIENKKMKLGTTEYHQLVYKGDQGVLKLIFTQNIWVKGNKAFCSYKKLAVSKH